MAVAVVATAAGEAAAGKLEANCVAGVALQDRVALRNAVAGASASAFAFGAIGVAVVVALAGYGPAEAEPVVRLDAG